VVPWTEVAGLFERLTGTPAAARAPAGGIAPESERRRLVRRLVYRLPAGLRLRLLVAARAQTAAAAALADLCFYAVTRGAALLRRAVRRRGPAAPTADFAALAKPGDVLAMFGAPWAQPDYAGLVRDARRRFGLRFALLVFDLIPIRRPEWCDRGLVRAFRAWFAATLPMADAVLAISRSTADDVERFAAANGIALAAPVAVIPIGTGFGATPPSVTARTPPAGSYELFVSTIEARKNHLLLFRVWRRLLDEMPRAAVPTLVFAGRVGWLVEDLMQQLANTDFLDGGIRLVEDPSDAELAGLYRGCRFTVFPSLYEGWGLPVTESFAFGKPCIAARGSSLPEAGGGLARYFDPESVSDAYGVIRAAIEDPEGFRAWEAEVVRGFVPVPWRATADAVLRGLGLPAAPAGTA